LTVPIGGSPFHPPATPAQGFTIRKEDAMTTEPVTDADSTPRGNPPVQKFADWPLEAAVWQHDGEHGPQYSVTLSRYYKDSDGKYQPTTRLFPEPLLPAGELQRQAYAWIRQQERAARAARKEKTPETAPA